MQNLPIQIEKESSLEREKYYHSEGELAVDVFETPKELVIKTAIAGVKPENLEIFLDNDILTIKGFREDEDDIEERNFLCQECYWGKFSRSIILPQSLNLSKAKAFLQRGVLKIIFPKLKRVRNKIALKEIEE